MASGTTSNLGLSQWAAEDFVRREDFNGDNQTLDEVIGLLRGKTLASVTTTSDASRIQLDVSDIDWKSYVTVVMDVTVKTQSESDCYLRANTDSATTGGYFLDPGSSDSNSKGLARFTSYAQAQTPGIARFTFWPLKSDSGDVACSSALRDGFPSQLGYTSRSSFSGFNTVYIIPSETSTVILSGTKITIRGYEI